MQTGKLFKYGRSQAVRLPAKFHFQGDEVLIRRDPVTGYVILSPLNRKFEHWLKLRDKLIVEAPKEFEDFVIPRPRTASRTGPAVKGAHRYVLDTDAAPTPIRGRNGLD